MTANADRRSFVIVERRYVLSNFSWLLVGIGKVIVGKASLSQYCKAVLGLGVLSSGMDVHLIKFCREQLGGRQICFVQFTDIFNGGKRVRWSNGYFFDNIPQGCQLEHLPLHFAVRRVHTGMLKSSAKVFISSEILLHSWSSVATLCPRCVHRQQEYH